MQRAEEASSDRCAQVREHSDKQTVVVLDAEHGRHLTEPAFADGNHFDPISRAVEPLGAAAGVVFWVEDAADFATIEGLHKLVFHLHGTGKLSKLFGIQWVESVYHRALLCARGAATSGHASIHVCG